MIDLKIDVELLRKQRNFLLGYPWRDAKFPEEIEGLVNLLDEILDLEEGYKTYHQIRGELTSGK